MEVCKETADLIAGCVEDGGQSVRESASEDLRAARGQMASLASRLQGLLRNHPGEVSEKVCQAAPFVTVCAVSVLSSLC